MTFQTIIVGEGARNNTVTIQWQSFLMFRLVVIVVVVSGDGSSSSNSGGAALFACIKYNYMTAQLSVMTENML